MNGMNQTECKTLLESYKKGEVSEEEVLLRLREAPYEDLGFAKLDHQRAMRTGAAEVIYGAGKTKEQIATIADAAWRAGQKTILITRISREKADYLIAGEHGFCVSYNETAQAAIAGKVPEADGLGSIVIATGGTSDQRVAEEAYVTARALGNDTVRLYDVGVAGLHRLLDKGFCILNGGKIPCQILPVAPGIPASLLDHLIDEALPDFRIFPDKTNI